MYAALSVIPTSEPDVITQLEWTDFVEHIVNKNANRKSLEKRYSLSPEDFRSVIDQVD